jgi:hypothetical protein
MSLFEMSEEEKNKIRKMHEQATKDYNDKKNVIKMGVTKPEPKKIEPEKK